MHATATWPLMNMGSVLRDRIELTLAGAEAAKAREIGDGRRIGSIPVALTKAVSLPTRRRPTTIGGNLPVVVDGRVAGAIVVSSGTVEEDLAVAHAGLPSLASHPHGLAAASLDQPGKARRVRWRPEPPR